jgi:2'-5' RNA ligase
MTKRRLFIAINLPEGIKRKLIEWQNETSTHFGYNSGEVNWVRKENLHITLVFIGYVSDDETYEIAKTMRQVAEKHEPFFINLERITTGPPDTTPRMFWAEGQKSQQLANLQNDLENALNFGGIYKKEARAFRSHITLARFKYNVAKQIKEMKDIGEKINYQIPVDSIELMQSNLRRTGPIYTILESVGLGE